VPAVATRFPNLPPARESTGESARLRITEAVHELATAIAEEQPVILVVDDVHLADDASVAVLHLFMRRTQEQPVMVVMTARQSELGNSPHAGRLLEHRDALALEAVELPPLTEEEMSEVVTALAAAAQVEMPPAVRRALLRTSAGVPMIAELLFDDWRAHGDECLALSVGAMTVDALGQDQQEVYHRVFERALRGLSAPARAVLNLAAILGERLNDLTMYELVDLSLAQTLAGMAELAEHRIIRDGGREVEFRNELLRGYTYLSVPSPLRRALHGLITDRLLSVEAKGEHVPGLILAWHCYRAGRPAQAEPYLLRGSREALRRCGTFEVELALTSAMKGLSRENTAEAKLILAEALQEQFRHPEVLRLLSDFDVTEPGDSSRRRLVGLRSTAALVDSEEEAREVLDSIQDLLTDGGPDSWKVAAIEAAQTPLYYLGDPTEAHKYLALIQTMERSHLDLEDEARLGATLATCVWLARKSAEMPGLERRLNSLCSRCRRSGLANLTTLNLLNTNACVQTTLGMYSEALEAFVSVYSIAAKLGNEPKMGSAAGNIAMCHGRTGNYRDQLQWAEKAICLLRGAGVGWKSHQAGYNRSLALCMMGENKRAVEAIEEVCRVNQGSRPPWSVQAAPLMTADIYFASGDRTKASRIAIAALGQTGIEPLTNGYAGTVARWVARTASVTGSRDDATALITALCNDLESHDLVDQAEIVCARMELEDACGRTWSDGRAILAEKLSRLPSAVEEQLRRLAG
jgi:predicted ATPase